MKQIIVKIDGMMCGHCEAHMNEAFKEKCMIKSVSSSHEKGQSVIVTEDDIPDSDLEAIVIEAVYEFKGVERKAYEQKGFFGKLMSKEA